MNLSSKHTVPKQLKAIEQMQIQVLAKQKHDNLIATAFARDNQQVEPLIHTEAQLYQRVDTKVWDFPHIAGNEYRSRQSGCLIDTFTDSYMRWESRAHVMAWLNSFVQPHSLRPVFLDTETTGTRCFSEIIEVSVVDEHGRTLFHSLVNPTTEIEPIATSIHGITHRHVMHAPRYPEIHDEVIRHLYGHVVIAYNAAFDLRLLRQSATRYELAFPKFHVACLMHAYAKYRPKSMKQTDERSKYKVYRLDDALMYEGLELSIPHRADKEAQCVQYLFNAMSASILQDGREI